MARVGGQLGGAGAGRLGRGWLRKHEEVVCSDVSIGRTQRGARITLWGRGMGVCAVWHANPRGAKRRRPHRRRDHGGACIPDRIKWSQTGETAASSHVAKTKEIRVSERVRRE